MEQFTRREEEKRKRLACLYEIFGSRNTISTCRHISWDKDANGPFICIYLHITKRNKDIKGHSGMAVLIE